MPKIDDLKWQIEARAKISTLLLRQYEYLQNHEGIFKANPDHRFVLLRMVQASFSLWRSAFLTDVKGTAHGFEKHTAQFLERLLTHNAIGFNDDYGSREFSVAYYNTNARYRIERMVKHDPGLAEISVIKHCRLHRSKILRCSLERRLSEGASPTSRNQPTFRRADSAVGHFSDLLNLNDEVKGLLAKPKG